MKLKIRNVGPTDYGSYRCVAKNSLGETDGLIKLEGKQQPVSRKLRWTEVKLKTISFHRINRTNHR